jgi:hypothetical protein
MFYKMLAPCLAAPLASIFNVSMGTGQIPDEWSKATVIPIFKNKGNAASPENYRPISLTNVACKIMETLIRQRLFVHLVQNNLLSNCQHGFFNGRSTVTQLLECMNDWTSSIENHEYIDVAYLDIAKAFDTVSHEKLLYKINKLGIRGSLLSWFKSFLSNRTQTVSVNNVLSDLSRISSGVPQGSVIGPLLFLLYIDDVTSVVKHSSIKLFADDTKLYVKGHRNEVNTLLIEDLSEIFQWFDTWQLNVAFQKCVILPIRGCRRDAVVPKYVINGTEIPSADNVRDLGYFVSGDLKPAFHISQIVRPAHSVACMINKAFVNTDSDFRVKLFNTFVRPKLEYASVIWNPYFKKDVNSVERIQRRYTKRMVGMWNLSYSTRLSRLNMISLEHRRLLLDLHLLYKIVYKKCSISFDSLFKFVEHGHATRGHNKKLECTRAKELCRKHFFSLRIVKAWNNLSSDVVNAPSLASFKNKLKFTDLSKLNN